jgi:hypothetical protein
MRASEVHIGQPLHCPAVAKERAQVSDDAGTNILNTAACLSKHERTADPPYLNRNDDTEGNITVHKVECCSLTGLTDTLHISRSSASQNHVYPCALAGIKYTECSTPL